MAMAMVIFFSYTGFCHTRGVPIKTMRAQASYFVLAFCHICLPTPQDYFIMYRRYRLWIVGLCRTAIGYRHMHRYRLYGG